VSAFQNIAADHLQDDIQHLDCDVLVCGNNPAAREVVVKMAQDIGLKAWHADIEVWKKEWEAYVRPNFEIHASPRGKRTQRIHLLSSGERALVALSLLFGIFLTKPSPFCLLDEVDAPLDDANIGRYVRMLTEFKKRTQFIVITHNPRTTTEAADAVYGVTMQEPGVSSIVAVRMRGMAVDDAPVGAVTAPA